MKKVIGEALTRWNYDTMEEVETKKNRKILLNSQSGQ